MSARRLLLSADDLARLQQHCGARLPPGFALSGAVAGPLSHRLAHPAVAADLAVLAGPELAVLLRATRPGLTVTACLAVAGPRGAGLLRTGDALVQLSAFPAGDIAAELARAVPVGRIGRSTEVVPLDVLLGPSGSRLHGRAAGALRAVVAGRTAAVAGSVEWVWDGAGWTSLEPLPSHHGRPMVRLEQVGPEDLAGRLAPLLAAAA